MEDGRLPASQLIGMRESYDYVFLLLHDRIASDKYGHLTVWVPSVPKGAKRTRDTGDRKYDAPGYNHGYWARAQYGAGRNLMYVDFWKWIMSLSVCGGVRLLQAGSNQEAGEVLAAGYEWFRKEWRAHKSLKTFDNSHTPTLTKPSIPALVAHALTYGIGWEKAMAAADHFSTARNMINASAEEWKRVEGIGDVLARRAVRAADTVHVHRTVTGRVEERHRKGKRD